jgi:hypothetical protein
MARALNVDLAGGERGLVEGMDVSGRVRAECDVHAGDRLAPVDPEARLAVACDAGRAAFGLESIVSAPLGTIASGSASQRVGPAGRGL